MPSTVPAPPSRTASLARWPRRLRLRGCQELRHHRRSAHRPLRQGNIDSWVRLLEIEADRLPTASSLTQSHYGRFRDPARREPRDREGTVAITAGYNTILEIEVGAVGGEEDGVVGDQREALHLHRRRYQAPLEALGLRRERPPHHRSDLRQRARRLQVRPREAASRAARHTSRRRVAGTSTSTTVPSTWSCTAAPAPPPIATAVANGVIKMNVDTDTPARSPARSDHMLRNYDGVLKIDGEVGVARPA